jgi:hypothetical protein
MRETNRKRLLWVRSTKGLLAINELSAQLTFVFGIKSQGVLRQGWFGAGFFLNKKFQEHTLIQNKILGRTAESETVHMKFIVVLVHFLGSSYSKSIPQIGDKR